MSGPSQDDDPGWPWGPRLLLYLMPGYMRFFGRHRGDQSRDGLVVHREVWLALTSGIVLFGVVVTLLRPGPQTGQPLPWALGICLAAVLALGVIAVLDRRQPLDCADAARLATSYRTRFFVRMALSDSVALFAFVSAFVGARWWLYWLAAAFTLSVFARNAPTRQRLAADQQALSAHGCAHDLVQALRRPIPPR